MDFVALFVLLFLQIITIVKGSIPVITQHPLNQTVVRNEPVSLDCRSTGDPVIEWFRDGQPVKMAPEDPSSHRMLLPDGSLFFLRAMQNKKEQDAGTYWCVASNSEGVVRSKNATLDIAYMRDDFRAVPDDTDAILGENVVLECSPPKGHPKPVVKWKKDGDNLDLTSSKRIKIDESGNLVIYKAQKKDQGRYQCSAENIATIRTSKPIRLKVHDPPFFVNKPKDTTAVVGQDVLIECQASGDPHPDIVWTKDEGDIDISKVRIVHGKGLRIEAAGHSDEGTYLCTAKNLVGTVTSSASLRIQEAPVISVRPRSSVQVQQGQAVKLDCLVTGTPVPLAFWIKEEKGQQQVVMYPGSSYDAEGGLQVSEDGSLFIVSAQVQDSGYYTCTTLNEVGSAVARTHVLVYDSQDFVDNKHMELYHPVQDLDLSEARMATMEDGVEVLEAFASGPTSIKVTWEFVANHKYLEGYKIWYKRADQPHNSFESISVMHTEATSFVINRLEEHTEYDLFVQPYYKNVPGKPAAIKRVKTHADVPSAAPVVLQAKLLNKTTVYLTWQNIKDIDMNGPLTGIEVVISGNGTFVNQTIPAGADQQPINEINLFVIGMAAHKVYTVQLAAVNSVGRGPFSIPQALQSSYGIQEDTSLPSFVNESEHQNKQLTWIIGAVSAATFVLIFVSGVIYYKRKLNTRAKAPLGYLAASTSADDFQICNNRPIIRPHDHKDSSLWIDHHHHRRWVPDNSSEKESNSSEKKLLAPQQNSSDTEYAYVDNNKHNLSSFTNSSGCSRKESPEPYATTDIFKRPPNNHYAAPHFHHHNRRSVQSCDDLTADQSARVPHNNNHQIMNPHPVQMQNYHRSNTGGGKMRRKPRNIMDILPPPPVHPPPPVTYNMSQESVISPKYLFAHPMYMPGPAGPGSRHKVHPTSHYEKVDVDRAIRLTPKQYNSNSFDRDFHDELQHFNAVVTQFGHNYGSKSSECNNANAASYHSDQYSLHCEADNDESCGERSSESEEHY